MPKHQLEWRRGGWVEGDRDKADGWRIYMTCPDGAYRFVGHIVLRPKNRGAHVALGLSKDKLILPKGVTIDFGRMDSKYADFNVPMDDPALLDAFERLVGRVHKRLAAGYYETRGEAVAASPPGDLDKWLRDFDDEDDELRAWFRQAVSRLRDRLDAAD